MFCIPKNMDFRTLSKKLDENKEDFQINMNTLAEDTIDEFRQALSGNPPHLRNGENWEDIYKKEAERSQKHFDNNIVNLFKYHVRDKDRAKTLLDGKLEEEIDKAIVQYRKNDDKNSMHMYSDLVDLTDIRRGNVLLDKNHDVKHKKIASYSTLIGAAAAAGLGAFENLTQTNITGPLTPLIAGGLTGGLTWAIVGGVAYDLKSRINDAFKDARKISSYVSNKESVRSFLHTKAKYSK